MAEYKIEPSEDDGFFKITGLKSSFGSGNVTIFKEADWSFKDLVYEVRANNKNVQAEDIFITPTEGSFKIDGSMIVPYTPPPPPPPVAAPTACTCGQTPCTCPPPAPVPVPIVPVPVAAYDSNGQTYHGTLNLPWPGATSSQILEDFDKISSSKEQGNILNTIYLPGQNGVRIIEIGYLGNKTRVVIMVG